MENKLFRKTAMDTVASPERLNEYIQITRPGIWGVLAGLLVLVVAIGIWGFTGSIPNTVKVKGIIFTHKGVIPVFSSELGNIEDIRVEKGEFIKKGEVLAIISQKKNLESKRNIIKVISPVSGTVLHTLNENQTLFLNEPIAMVINQEDTAENRDVISYIESSVSKRLANGMKVEVSPFFASREEYGYMYGKIKKIGEYPVSQDEIIRSLGKIEYASNILPEGDFVKVDIELESDKNSKNKIKWSSKKGELIPIKIGTQLNIQIVTKIYKPYELVFK